MTCKTGNMCFVLMPFASEFKNQWELAFQPAIEESDLVPWRGDEEKLGTNIIMHDVTRCIANAKLIIADLTGKNPNVMYELGLAHAAKKPVIILAQDNCDVPFDLQHVRYLKYDKNNLTELKSDLKKKIKHTLAMEASEQPDLFPELIVMNEKDFEELQYLRVKMPELQIKVYPPTADIFFNDKLLGPSPQTVKVNPDAPINSVSASVAGYFEYHEELKAAQIQKGILGIILEPRDKHLLQQRVPKYLRQRRKFPNNPVLMRAISSYFADTDQSEEVVEETKELLEIAPYWYLAHNQKGYILPYADPFFDKKIEDYKHVVALRPDLDLGTYNLACTYSCKEDYPKCLSSLRTILESPKKLASYCFNPVDIVSMDSDFDLIRGSKQYGKEFKEIEKQFISKWTDFEEERQAARKQVEDFGRN